MASDPWSTFLQVGDFAKAVIVFDKPEGRLHTIELDTIVRTFKWRDVTVQIRDRAGRQLYPKQLKEIDGVVSFPSMHQFAYPIRVILLG